MGSFRQEDLDTIGRVLGGCTAQTSASEAATIQAAVAMVLRENESGLIETLFIRRAEHPDDPWSGQMAMPGGRMDPEDESLEAAACRETFEEVGLRLEPDMLIARLHDVGGGRLRSVGLSVSPFVYRCANGQALTPNYEVADTVWVPLEFLGDPGNITDYFFHLDPMQRAFPALDYNGYTIWGLTYRIIASFMEPFGIVLPGEPQVTDVE